MGSPPALPCSWYEAIRSQTSRCVRRMAREWSDSQTTARHRGRRHSARDRSRTTRSACVARCPRGLPSSARETPKALRRAAEAARGAPTCLPPCSRRSARDRATARRNSRLKASAGPRRPSASKPAVLQSMKGFSGFPPSKRSSQPLPSRPTRLRASRQAAFSATPRPQGVRSSSAPAHQARRPSAKNQPEQPPSPTWYRSSAPRRTSQTSASRPASPVRSPARPRSRTLSSHLSSLSWKGARIVKADQAFTPPRRQGRSAVFRAATRPSRRPSRATRLRAVQGSAAASCPKGLSTSLSSRTAESATKRWLPRPPKNGA
mmetsp:Transcript_103363/g.308788  ORF Transcript_103363/g.308788 Transcript_103363/m.308788 type:complete len:319 (+) Transcript_103363:340-1296(+)